MLKMFENLDFSNIFLYLCSVKLKIYLVMEKNTLICSFLNSEDVARFLHSVLADLEGTERDLQWTVINCLTKCVTSFFFGSKVCYCVKASSLDAFNYDVFILE